ncbi:Aste57867_11903 [Aphanomyces stellatus]|uniref:Aste57867_11903 protein n=1 Tax=Aphanomyces stellatus TaxID=120398 RepID=A0A485KU85_9STRA|nr:hypothetical protein As57867_011858 [Aphanomyces stellatus]VFT88758.1 Aste57867_11903 [Aphanomyces stellatus]
MISTAVAAAFLVLAQVASLGHGYCNQCQGYTALYSGQGNNHLSAGQKLWSDGYKFFATMQWDGNFVVYDCNRQLVSATNTAGWGGNNIQIQSDGNFVMYRPNGSPVWASHTDYQGQGPYCVKLDSYDGTLNIFDNNCWGFSANSVAIERANVPGVVCRQRAIPDDESTNTTKVPATDLAMTDSPTTELPATAIPATDIPVTESPTSDVAESLPTDSPETDSPASDLPTMDLAVPDLPATDLLNSTNTTIQDTDDSL